MILDDYIPKLRFPEFEGEWEHNAIDSLCDTIVDCINKTAPLVDQPTPYKMLRTTNIRNGMVDRTECRRVSEETFIKWTRRATIDLGDVILTREAPIGEVGYVDFSDAVFLGQRLMQYKTNNNKLIGKYLLYSFLAPKLQSEFRSHSGNGSTVGHIRVGDCTKFTISYPPLPEQQKIASFLTSVDDKIGQLQRKKTALEAYKKGMMQQLFSQQTRFKDDQGNSFPDWEEKKLGEVANIVGGGTPETIKEDYWNGEINWFTPTEIKTKYLIHSKRKISALGLKKSSAKTLPAGTLLLSTRATVGDVGIATKECSTNQGFQSWVMCNDNYNEFWYYWILHNKKEFIRKSSGSTFIEICKTEIQRIKAQAPHPAEQQKIADFLTALDRKIDLVAQELTQAQTFKKGLLQQMFI